MATHKQAEKRHRQSIDRKARNAYYKATLRTFLKNARVALGDLEGVAKDAAGEAVIRAVSFIDHVAVRGIIPAGRAARLKSRLESQLAAR